MQFSIKLIFWANKRNSREPTKLLLFLLFNFVKREARRSVMSKVLNSEFKPYAHQYVYLRTKTFRKGMNAFISTTNYKLNRIS